MNVFITSSWWVFPPSSGCDQAWHQGLPGLQEEEKSKRIESFHEGWSQPVPMRMGSAGQTPTFWQQAWARRRQSPLPWLRQLHIAIMCSCGNARQALLKTQQKLENEDWGNQNLLGILTISSLNFLWKKLKQINKPRTHKLRRICSGVLTLYHLKENLLSFLTARVYVWGSVNWSPTVHVTGLDNNKFWSVGPSFFLR